jgi:hypothetical protein
VTFGCLSTYCSLITSFNKCSSHIFQPYTPRTSISPSVGAGVALCAAAFHLAVGHSAQLFFTLP